MRRLFLLTMACMVFSEPCTDCDCGPNTWLNGSACVECTFPACDPGFFTFDCTPWNDTQCLECPTQSEPGTFVWTENCGVSCNVGYFLENGVCIPCMASVLCPPGFQISECTPVSNTQCRPCGILSAGAMWTQQCDIACLDGFFMQDGSCERCNAEVCATGTYKVDCTQFEDGYCTSCPAPGGDFEWTEGCGFQCKHGSYLDGATCVPCAEPKCGPGTYATNCSAFSDAACAPCPNHAEGVIWTEGCSVGCDVGYYYADETCHRCSPSPSCGGGTYPVECSATGDSRCDACVSTMLDGFVWTRGCGFVCLDGYFLANSTFCTRCTEVVCEPGSVAVPCSKREDSFCVACPGAGRAGTTFSEACTFACDEGYFLNGTLCEPCSPTACSPGSRSLSCSQTSDAECVECESPGDVGPFVWLEECRFECAAGFQMGNGSRCGPSPPPVFTVVHTSLDVRNPIEEICIHLATLIQAMNEALASLSNVEYVSNVTALDGKPCLLNVCPQCNNASTPYLPLRRLLQSGVPVTVVSQSTGSTPSAPVIPSGQLTTAIQSSLLSSPLNAQATSTNVSVVQGPPPDWVPAPTFWDENGEIVVAAVGIFCVCVLALGLGCGTAIKRRMIPDKIQIPRARQVRGSFPMPGIVVKKRNNVV